MNTCHVTDHPCIAQVRITPEGVWLNGAALEVEGTGKAMLTALYKQAVKDYPKYYKMDPLARLGFLAAELLLRENVCEASSEEGNEECAIVLVNRSASLAADRKYETTIAAGDEYFPSPADFVYTLPNIVTGEIAIRHKINGETTFLVLPDFDQELIGQLIGQAFVDTTTQRVLGGWLECIDENHFDAEVAIYRR